MLARIVLTLTVALGLVVAPAGAAPRSASSSPARACAPHPLPRNAPPPYGRAQIRADVDGDGRRDEVFISYGSERVPVGCRFTLVARTARGLLIHTIREGLIPAAMQHRVNSEIVGLAGARYIDRSRGAEVLLDLFHSASGQGLGVYTVRGRRIVPLRVRGAELGLFYVWASLGTGIGRVNCIGGRESGRVVASGWSRKDRTIHRRIYEVRGASFRLVTDRSYP